MNALKRLLPMLKPYRGRFAAAAAAMSVLAVANGGIVYLLKNVVDDVLVSRDWALLYFVMAAIPGLVFIKASSAYAQNYLMSYIGQSVVQDLRAKLFRHLHDLSLDYYWRNRTAEVLSRVTNDLNYVQSAVHFVPLYLIRDSLTVLVLLGILFHLNAQIAAVSLIAIPPVGGLLAVFARKMRRSSRGANEAMAEIYHRFQESMQGIAVIKAFRYEEPSVAKFEAENDRYFGQMMKYLKATALSGPLMEFLGSLVMAGLIFLGGREIIEGRLTPGEFLTFFAGFMMAYSPTKNLARMNATIQLGVASAERIFQVLDEKPSVDPNAGGEKAPALARALEFKDLTFTYPSRETPALDKFSARFEKGKTTAVVGPSGSGKSTLVQLLLRLIDPQEGAVLIDGKNLHDVDLDDFRKQIGLVTQETVLFHDTIAGNVAMARPGASREEIEKACKTADAHEFIQDQPQGYDTVIGERGVRLSGGQRQRLAIARAVLRGSEILIFDEATSNLDSSSEKAVSEALKRASKGHTVILIAHRLSTVRHADNILVLAHGELVEQGTHEELLAQDGVYHNLFRLQQSKAEPAAA